MVIDSLKKGTVIDHITAGKGMTLLNYLAIDTEHETVAIIINAVSKKRGRKDIIKIDNRIDVDMNVIGLVDPDATVSIIVDGRIVEKKHPKLPARVENVIKCRNPRCVTNDEENINHTFVLTDENSREYRCIYCDETVSMK